MASKNLGVTHGLIAMQVAPTLFWGLSGVGKTSALEALSNALARTFIPLIGSNMAPEDSGGYPFPDKNGFIRRLPPMWAKQAEDGNGLIFTDEVTNVPSAVQAGLLSIITEGLVGDYRLPKSTLFVGACNPPELCPNAVPLSVAMRARFVHIDWEIDWDNWFAGLRSGCNWAAPSVPVVPSHWEDSLPQFGSLLEAFLRSNPDARVKMPIDDETRSFPTLRTWTYLVRCFAAAEACGYEWRKERKDPVFAALGTACVGKEHSSMFLRYAHQLDLINPEAYLEGEVEYEYENRPDANICLLTGLVKALRSNPTKERWVRASEAFVAIGEHEIESFLMQFKSFWKPVKDGGVRPDGWTPPKETLGKLMALVQS